MNPLITKSDCVLTVSDTLRDNIVLDLKASPSFLVRGGGQHDSHMSQRSGPIDFPETVNHRFVLFLKCTDR